ncbi:MAG: helix-turn-helix domain-containing protein [Planctomycetes bacterium]|nr:helix-turn-helix domain-containing protein [Planctomycetota bacterium]
MSHFTYKDYFAAHRRMIAECGEHRRAATVHPGYYSQRIVAAFKDPATAGPHLARAIKLWPRPLAPCWTETGESIPGGFDVWVRHLRTLVDAIDDDDEDDEVERERAELIAQHANSPYLTAEEARVYLRLSTVRALYRLIGRGVLRKLPGRHRCLFTREMLDEYLTRRRPSH